MKTARATILSRSVFAAGTLALAGGCAEGASAEAPSDARRFSAVTIALNDGVQVVRAGDAVNYRIELYNADTAPAYVVASSFSDPTMGCTWTCAGSGGTTCSQASGRGYLSEGVSLAGRGGVTFVATCVAPPQAPAGSLLFRAGFSPASFGLPYAEDYNRLDAPTDLKVTSHLLPATVAPGQMTQVRFDLSNEGPNGTHGTFSASAPFNPWWTCTPAGGALCPPDWSAGYGPVSDKLVYLPSGASISLEAVSAAPADAAGPYPVTAVLQSPAGDPVAGNNATTDTLQVNGPYVDLAVASIGHPPRLGPGLPLSFRARASNGGTVAAAGKNVSFGISPGSVSTGSCVGGSGGTACTPDGAPGNFTVSLPPGGHVDLEIIGTVANLPGECPDGQVRLYGSIAAGTSTDPLPLNNTIEIYVPCPLFHDGFDAPLP